VIRIHEEVAVFVGKGMLYHCNLPLYLPLFDNGTWRAETSWNLTDFGVFSQFGVVGLINESVQ